MWGAIVFALGVFALIGFNGASVRAGTPGAAVPSVTSQSQAKGAMSWPQGHEHMARDELLEAAKKFRVAHQMLGTRSDSRGDPEPHFGRTWATTTRLWWAISASDEHCSVKTAHDRLKPPRQSLKWAVPPV